MSTPGAQVADAMPRPGRSGPRILTAGYLALDAVLYNQRGVLRAGGTAGNVAANLAFLGWQAGVVGRLGSDGAGTALAEDLTAAGVSVDLLEISNDASTPVVFHHVLPQGPRYTFRCPLCGRKMGRHSPPRPDAVSALTDNGKESPNVFFFDRASRGTVQLAAIARELGSLVVFEPSSTGMAHLFREAVRIAHIVKYSSDRAASVEAALSRRPAGQIRIVTQGPEGLDVTFRSGWQRLPSFQSHAIDTAGAGDWATAAFLYSLPSLSARELDDSDLWTALKFAQAVAAISCSFVGARGMAVTWTRSKVLSVARTVIAGGLAAKPRQPVAGKWISEGALLAALCGIAACDTL